MTTPRERLAQRLYRIDGHHKDSPWENVRAGRQKPYLIMAGCTLKEAMRVLELHRVEEPEATLATFPDNLLRYIADKARAGHRVDPLIIYELNYGGPL